MEQQRGNHEINWKTPITEEDTDGNVNDDDGDDDDDNNNNIKSTIARQGPANRCREYQAGSKPYTSTTRHETSQQSRHDALVTRRRDGNEDWLRQEKQDTTW